MNFIYFSFDIIKIICIFTIIRAVELIMRFWKGRKMEQQYKHKQMLMMGMLEVIDHVEYQRLIVRM